MPACIRTTICLITLIFIFGCDRNGGINEDLQISGYYKSNDSLAYMQAIENEHKNVRDQISLKLTEFLLLKADDDTSNFNPISDELDWLVRIYVQKSGISDLSLKYVLYSGFNSEQSQLKIKLDSLLKSLDFIVDEITFSELEERLDAFSAQAISLDDKFALAKCVYYKAKGFQNRGKIDSAMYYFKKCGATCIKHDFYDLLANCEFMLAKIYGYNLNDYLQSELSYQNVIDYSEKIDDDKLTRYVLLGRTHNYLQL